MAKVMSELRVKDVMSKDIVAVYPDDTLHEALDLIVENRISALPVVNGKGECLGVLSTTDLIDLTHELDDEIHNLGRTRESGRTWLIEQLADALGSEHVSSQMTREVATIGPEATLPEAAGEMARNRVHRLPVVDKNKRLLGIVSTMDIIRAVADGAPHRSQRK